MTAMLSYQLLTTTRYDPFLTSLEWNNDRQGPSAFLLLDRHVNRLADAASKHDWGVAKEFLSYDHVKSSCIEALKKSQTDDTSTIAFRMRIVVSKLGAISVTTSPTFPLIKDPSVLSLIHPSRDDLALFGPVYDIYIDSSQTESSLFTRTKTTYRPMYEAARSRLDATLGSITSPATSDILLFNSHNSIVETTIFNVAFYRSQRWITPHSSTGCLPGVFRRWLLDCNHIYEDTDNTLDRGCAVEGEYVLLFNGSQGCRLGRIVHAIS